VADSRSDVNDPHKLKSSIWILGTRVLDECLTFQYHLNSHIVMCVGMYLLLVLYSIHIGNSIYTTSIRREVVYIYFVDRCTQFFHVGFL
jgi:hypothetical protein